MPTREKILKIVLVFLIGLFCFSLFKNIQYPLMWEDEADTAMFAKRILQFGYPKVHDGKNVVSPFNSKENYLAINQKFDAYLYSGWLPMYFASIPVRIAENIQDIYAKTAILRIPFAIVGMLGLSIFALSIFPVFGKNKKHKLLFLVLFAFLELFSISLVLHLREVRYYSLAIFLTSCLFYFYFRYHFFHNINFNRYLGIMLILLLLLFNTYHPIYFIFMTTIIIYTIFVLYKKIKKSNHNHLSDLVKPFVLPAVSFVSIIPLLIFFKTFELSSETAKAFGFNLSSVGNNIYQIWFFLSQFEYLTPFLILKIILVLSLGSNKFWKEITANKKFHLSNFLSLFFLIHIIFIANSPLMFTRYFIVLLPILPIIVLLDFFTILEFLPRKKLFTAFTAVILFFSLSGKIESVQGHIYELFHQYKGPVDYTIPYIQDNFKNPQNLVIATNYEETSYMYYLGSKVIIGYLANNLAEDMKYTPDIVSYRKIPWWGKAEIFLKLMEKEKYDLVSFPVADYLYNNIPDLYFNINAAHLFKTRFTDDSNKKVVLFVRENLLEKQY